MRAWVPLTLGTMAVLLLATLVAVSSPVKTAHAAGGVSGAIFTTISDGSEVNYNIYADKGDVYLNGGPGAGAPNSAAGLPDGNYYFQVTDPSGKTLLSTDAVQCREFVVTGGVISSYVPNCPGTNVDGNHLIGTNVVDGGKTIQLMPYLDTPNPGGVYKVWATPIGNYACDPTAADPTACSTGKFGFIPRYSKTDNFKVKGLPREGDGRFHDSVTGQVIDGLEMTWTDTLGASNNKWSYYSQALDVNHEAHVEALENGTHQFTFNDQPGCKIVGPIQVTNTYTGKSYYTNTSGAQTVSVNVTPSFVWGTIFFDVTCDTSYTG